MARLFAALAGLSPIDVAQGAVAGVVMICVLVVVHEAGHFFMARLFGIGAPVFSIGFGPRIAGFYWRGTDWRISAIPFGGYVRLAGADPFGEEDPDDMVEPGTELTSKPIWQRLLVMAAGPLASLALPIFLFTAVKMAGEPEPDSVIGQIEPGLLADQAGFRAGDRVVTVAGEPVETWTEFLVTLGDHVDGNPKVVVERDGARVDLAFPPNSLEMRPDVDYLDIEPLGISHHLVSPRVGVDDPTSPAWKAGLRTGDAIVGVDGEEIATWNELQQRLAAPGPHELAVKRAVLGDDGKTFTLHDLPPMTLQPDLAWAPRTGDPATDARGLVPVLLFVGGVDKTEAAAEAGVLRDDRIWSVDGVTVRTWSDLQKLVGATVQERTADAKPRPLDLVVIRDGEMLTLSFAPRIRREIVLAEVRHRPIMGVSRYTDAVEGGKVKKYYSLVEAVPSAFEDVWMLMKLMGQMFSNMLVGDIKVTEGFGGPVQIFRVAAEGAQAGPYVFLRVIGSISLSLGIVNFMPVPVLDGGQIVFYLVEWIRGRPLSIELRERVQAVGVLAIAAMFLLIMVSDMGRWLKDFTS